MILKQQRYDLIIYWFIGIMSFSTILAPFPDFLICEAFGCYLCIAQLFVLQKRRYEQLLRSMIHRDLHILLMFLADSGKMYDQESGKIIDIIPERVTIH